jgi:hypothetical protein
MGSRAPAVVPDREDFRFRAASAPVPDSSAVIFHMMDVSGSMGREQKEIVRIEAFWIDTWLRSQYRTSRSSTSSTTRSRSSRRPDAFFHLRESGGTKISSAYELCLKLIQERYRAEDWNIYPFHYSDGDNWSARDTERCVALLRDELLPRVNQFCYGQVKSAYGSGSSRRTSTTRSAATNGGDDRCRRPRRHRRRDPRVPREGALTMQFARTSLPVRAAAEPALWAERIERVARALRLDFFEIVFELLDAADVNGIAAYGGFPVRYPSWRFGMEFERLRRATPTGLSKIYELVINNDPVVAYLVRSNSTWSRSS